MKKRLLTGVIALLMTAGMAIVASTATADPMGKVLVNHNGQIICVSKNSAHLAHGDEELANCTKKKKAKKKVTKRK